MAKTHQTVHFHEVDHACQLGTGIAAPHRSQGLCSFPRNCGTGLTRSMRVASLQATALGRPTELRARH